MSPLRSFLTIIRMTSRTAFRSLLTCTLFCVLTARVHAWEPNVEDLNSAIHSGDFTQYLNNTSAWLNRKMPEKSSEAALITLLKEPTFAHILAERQLIADPDAKDGLHLKLAIATTILPPGSVNIGAGGKQVNFQKNIHDSWVEYALLAPTTGTYSLTIKVAAANVDQAFHIKTGSSEPVTVKIPWSRGLWDAAPAVDIKLENGPQTLRISAPLQRVIAVRHLELKSK